MALITKTVGVDGDFADYSAVCSYLDSESPLSDDYTFNQISDISQTSYTNTSFNTSTDVTILINGGGYVTTSTTSCIRLTNASITDSIFKVYNMIIALTGTDTITAIYFSGRTYDGTSIYNCYIYNLTANNKTTGIVPGDVNTTDHSYWNIYNCIFYNLWRGIIPAQGGTSGVGVKPEDARIVENCSLFNCGFDVSGSTGYALYMQYIPSFRDDAYIQFRNVHTLRNDEVVEHDVYYEDSTCTATNCATTDESTYEDIEDANPGATTDCLDDLTASEHLISTTFGSSKFLKPKKYSGTGIYNGGTTPETPTHDYDGIEYGLGGLYPIGAYQYIKQLRSRIIGVV